MPELHRSSAAREHEMMKRARTAALRARTKTDLIIESVYVGEVETITTIGKRAHRSVAPLTMPRLRWLEREPA